MGNAALPADECYKTDVVRRSKIEATVQGSWNKALVHGSLLIWATDNFDGLPVSNERVAKIIEGTDFSFKINVGTKTYGALLSHDGKLHWSNGDVWIREEEQTLSPRGKMSPRGTSWFTSLQAHSVIDAPDPGNFKDMDGPASSACSVAIKNRCFYCERQCAQGEWVCFVHRPLYEELQDVKHCLEKLHSGLGWDAADPENSRRKTFLRVTELKKRKDDLQNRLYTAPDLTDVEWAIFKERRQLNEEQSCSITCCVRSEKKVDVCIN